MLQGKEKKILMTQYKAKKFFRLLVFMLIAVFVLFGNLSQIFGLEGDDRNILVPTDTQFLEMRATTISEMADGTKQLIMEFWGHDLIFQRI